MLELEKKRRMSRIAYSAPALVVLGILILFAANATWGVFTTYRESRANRERAESELAALESRRDIISSEVARFETPEGIEAAIREKYGLVKEGEGVIIIVPETASAVVKGNEVGSFLSSLWEGLRSIFARD